MASERPDAAADGPAPAAGPTESSAETGTVEGSAPATSAAPEGTTAGEGAAPLRPAVAGGAIELHLIGRTDVGLVREHNEDNYTLVRLDDDEREPGALQRHALQPRGTLLVVCDGMGGAAAGEVASSMAVATLPEMMRSDATAAPPAGVVDDEEAALARKLRFAAEEANRRIFAEQQANVARSGMGTTMTAALLRGDRAVIAQVGDSRCYVYRRGLLTQVTRDQSLVNQLLETGQITAEQAKYFEHSNVILQALGVQEDVEVQLSRVALRRGDRFMLCSDGLVGVISDEEIAAVLGSVEDPDEASRILIELANGAGGPDNITVVVAYVDGEGLADPSEADAIEYQTWHIDPPTPDPIDEALPPELADMPVITAEELAPPAPPLRTSELFSMAAIVGLIVGAIVVGVAMYGRAVPCEVRAARAGMVVVTDGRDSGARTVEGTVGLRLRPGHHRVALASGHHGSLELATSGIEVDVVAGQACALSFDEATTAAEPPP